jgi:hypothetical protein
MKSNNKLFYFIDENQEKHIKIKRSKLHCEYLPKIAELLNVDIKDLFENQVSKIDITQNNSDNKDNSINGLFFVLSDKESLENLATVLKNKMP